MNSSQDYLVFLLLSLFLFFFVFEYQERHYISPVYCYTSFSPLSFFLFVQTTIDNTFMTQLIFKGELTTCDYICKMLLIETFQLNTALNQLGSF